MTDTALDYSQASCMNNSGSNASKDEKDQSLGLEKDASWSSQQTALLQKIVDSGLSHFEIIKYLCEKEFSSRLLLEKVFKLFHDSNNNRAGASETKTDPKWSPLEKILAIPAKPTYSTSSTQTDSFFSADVEPR